MGSKDIKSYQRRAHDRYHGWFLGRRQELPPLGAISRLIRVVNAKLPPTLPHIDFVTSFIMRRQTRRQLSSTALRRIFQSLPNLVHVDYEPWRGYFRVPDSRYPEDQGWYILGITLRMSS